MQVCCSQCSTEYEFEDALISSRGTSVKCTQCGHEFRVHPPPSADSADDTWLVRLQAGEERTFTTLRSLQQAIVRGQLLPVDSLSRGHGPSRLLGDMPELQSFFTQAARRLATLPPPQRPNLALASLRPPSSMPPPSGGIEGASASGFASKLQAGVRTLPPPVAIEAYRSSAPLSALATAQRPDEVEPPPLGSSPEPPGASQSGSVAVWNPQPVGAPAPGPRRSPKWALVLGLGLVLGVSGALLVPRVSSSPPARSPRELVAESAAQVEALLARARARLQAGQLEETTVELAKASVLLPNSPRTKVLWATLEKTQAERLWLTREALRELAAADSQSRELHEVALNRVARRLDARLGKLEAALGSAEAAQPGDPEVAGARIDLLRMRGRVAEARRAMPSWSAEHPEEASAFPLAALDYAASRLSAGTAGAVMGAASRAALRLRDLPPSAARPESRALAVLSLHKAGDTLTASRELRMLEKHAPHYPLIAPLELLLRHEPQPAKGAPAAAPGPGDPSGAAAVAAAAWGDAGPASALKVAGSGASQEPKRRPAPRPPEPRPVTGPSVPAGGALSSAPGGVSRRISGSVSPAAARAPRVAVAAASRAAAPPPSLESAQKLQLAGRLSAAADLYSQLLKARPDAVPVLLGLGSLERQRKQPELARSYYERALAVDPGNVRALGALADMSWFAGDRAVAVARYRRVLARAGPESRVGKRALRRIERYEAQERPQP